jgi:tetraacyldisaccharide 4'-kinase
MSRQQQFLSLISGRSRGVGASLARAGLLALEPIYRGAVAGRNALFDNGYKRSVALGRPTISVGNITTGGTGKTPVVQWLAGALAARGRKPAVLLRGYHAENGFSDEEALYTQSGIPCQADPDRVAGAAALLQRDPQIDTFILDDGFQHRRARRCFDLVLIDATNPFGHGHTLPRGLLREPPSTLERADAILLTRVDPDVDLAPLRAQLRRYAPTAPILQSRHVLRGFIDGTGAPVPSQALGRVLALSGIGNPEGFHDSIRRFGATVVEAAVYSDHHKYTERDLQQLADHRGAFDTIATTEKDWVKLSRLPSAERLPFARGQLAFDFADGDAERLLTAIEASIARDASASGKTPG